jgi:hypothetical protein
VEKEKKPLRTRDRVSGYRTHSTMSPSSGSLDREYGVLLGITGPILMDRAKTYRNMARLVGPGKAADWLNMQADRAESTIKVIADKFNERC